MILLPHDPLWTLDLIIASMVMLMGKEHKQWYHYTPYAIHNVAGTDWRKYHRN